MRKPILWGLVVVLGTGVALGVWRAQSGSPGAARGSGTTLAAHDANEGPVSVSTFVAERRDWPETIATSGTVTALNTVEIRPQVASVIEKVHIAEGQFVKAGELLFTLDSRADAANLAKAQAQLQRDQAALADAERQLARSRDLLNQKFVSQSAVDTNLTLVEGQRAAVGADQAAIAAARVALSYSRIVAPSAGRAGAIDVYAGSYVQPSGAPLVTITQLDPIAVAFTLPQRNLQDVLGGLKAGNAPVSAELPDGRATLTGRLQFVDNVVDAASGTVRLKAEFDNKQHLLWPGAYVNVRLVVRTLPGVIVIPQAAIIQGPSAKTVFVVGADGKAAQREVELIASAGTLAVVSGIAPGTPVVVEGKQNLRPGSAVQLRAADGAASGAASANVLARASIADGARATPVAAPQGAASQARSSP
ncbi:MAG TPA: efflux RND transporter periplasmic adaptor subunit [Burkholderiaceae bacterium]|nr:efflux RND transporter periplasmic adaptor subunit [Burkholderiaceae bacterium]